MTVRVACDISYKGMTGPGWVNRVGRQVNAAVVDRLFVVEHLFFGFKRKGIVDNVLV